MDIILQLYKTKKSQVGQLSETSIFTYSRFYLELKKLTSLLKEAIAKVTISELKYIDFQFCAISTLGIAQQLFS